MFFLKYPLQYQNLLNKEKIYFNFDKLLTWLKNKIERSKLWLHLRVDEALWALHLEA